MNRFPSTFASRIRCATAMALLSMSMQSHAEGGVVDQATITSVFVNGGTDTSNPGTTCIKVSKPVLAACTGGMIAIRNNNKQLVATALLSKVTANPVWVYYDNAGSSGAQHCPGQFFTPCSVISIESK